jgi:hypothetical protein
MFKEVGMTCYKIQDDLVILVAFALFFFCPLLFVSTCSLFFYLCLTSLGLLCPKQGRGAICCLTVPLWTAIYK